MGASITLDGESLIALKQSKQEVLQVAQFVLANIPGLDTAKPIDRAAGLPADEHIVYTRDVTREGYLSPNKVVYSLMLDSSIGDFSFNWIGLKTAEQVLLIAAYVPLQHKRQEIPSVQSGNNLTRNIILDYNGAQALTGIQVPASTWQFDFTENFSQITADLTDLRGELDKKLDKADYLPPVSICLDGPVLIYPGSSNTYRITDYHRFSAYSAKSNVGTVTLNADTLTLAIPSDAPAGMVNLEVQRDAAKMVQKIPLGAAAIQQPAFTSPAANATGVTFEPILTLAPFVVYPSGYDKHVKTRWQLSRNAAFTDLVFDIVSSTSLTSFNLADAGYRLEPSRQYHGRAMMMGETLTSVVGAVTFNTAATYIRRPAITSPADGQTRLSSRPTLMSDAFTVSGGTDEHTGSRWQISNLADFSVVTVDSGWTTSALVNFTPEQSLANATQFYARMKKRGKALGETEWSPVVRFTTSDELKGIFTQLNGGATARYNHSSVVIDGKIYTHGGQYRSGGYVSDLWVYDPATNTWAKLASGPYDRYGHHAVAYRGKMYVHGGWGFMAGVSGSTTTNTLYVYDPVLNTWSQLASGPYCYAGSMVVIGDKFYLYGGHGNAPGYSNTYLPSLYEYDVATNKWKQLTSAPNPRMGHSAVVMNGLMYVFGGTRGAGYYNDLYVYDPATDKWTQLGTGATQRHEHVAVAIGSKMYIYGGEQASANNADRYMRDLWVYDATANSWKALGTGATGRQSATAVVINDEMYLFGGVAILGGTDLNDLWRIS